MMSRMGMMSSLIAILALTAACSTTSVGSRDALTKEAEAFMAAYGDDLRERNVEGVIDRYDRRGSYMAGNGRKEFLTFDEIATQYRSGWKGPDAFEWLDLSYEPVGPDAIVVVGKFRWTPRGGGEPVLLSYTSLLVRDADALRIRLEDESR